MDPPHKRRWNCKISELGQKALVPHSIICTLNVQGQHHCLLSSLKGTTRSTHEILQSQVRATSLAEPKLGLGQCTRCLKEVGESISDNPLKYLRKTRKKADGAVALRQRNITSRLRYSHHHCRFPLGWNALEAQRSREKGKQIWSQYVLALSKARVHDTISSRGLPWAGSPNGSV